MPPGCTKFGHGSGCGSRSLCFISCSIAADKFAVDNPPTAAVPGDRRQKVRHQGAARLLVAAPAGADRPARGGTTASWAWPGTAGACRLAVGFAGSGATCGCYWCCGTPVRRVISDYAQRLHRRASQGRPPVSLESLVFRRGDGSRRIDPRSPLVATSVYHRHLARWLAEFPRHQLHIVDGDRLVEKPFEELRLAEQFLGLPSRFRPEQFVYNASKGFYCARWTTTPCRAASARKRSSTSAGVAGDA
uniref:Sulfotransfer_1 domain-containing protein n=1 Tax=Macrostomum lignano TaxID=282301 RepID=A0A1I8FRH7_9PLAT